MPDNPSLGVWSITSPAEAEAEEQMIDLEGIGGALVATPEPELLNGEILFQGRRQDQAAATPRQIETGHIHGPAKGHGDAHGPAQGKIEDAELRHPVCQVAGRKIAHGEMTVLDQIQQIDRLDPIGDDQIPVHVEFEAAAEPLTQRIAEYFSGAVMYRFRRLVAAKRYVNWFHYFPRQFGLPGDLPVSRRNASGGESLM